MAMTLRSVYNKFIRPFLKTSISRQRVKLFWFGWYYSKIFLLPNLTLSQKAYLLKACLRTDWYVPHQHRASEMVDIFSGLSKRPAQPGEIMVEAGCFNGGSTIKFSVICHMLGYKLRVYDSFEGVEKMSEDEINETGFNYSGMFAVAEERVRGNVRKYGKVDICSFHKGWFSDTLAIQPLQYPVKVVFIDCDVATGTLDVLKGVVNALTKDAIIFSQDYTIPAVNHLIHNPDTWEKLNVPPPTTIMPTHNMTAYLTWN